MPYGDYGDTGVEPTQLPLRPGQRARFQPQPFIAGEPPAGGNVASFLGGQAPAPQANVGAFLGAKPPAMPQPLAPSQYGNADLDAAAGNPFALGYGQQRLGMERTPEFAQRQQTANDLLQAVRGRPVQPGEEGQAMDYFTRWSQQKNAAPTALPDQHAMTITNGNQTATTNYAKNAAGGMTGTAPAGTPDLTDPQQRNTAIQRVTMGLPFGTQALGTGADGQPLTGLPLMTEAVTAGQLAGLNPKDSADVYNQGQRNELLGQQMHEAERVQHSQVYEKAMERLKQAPAAPRGRAMSPGEMQAIAQKEADDWLSTFRGNNAAKAGGAPGDSAGKGGTGPKSPERTKLDALGPVPGYLQTSPDAATFWRSVLAYDKTNKGFMEKNGQNVIDAFNSASPVGALESFMNPGMVQSAATAFGNLFRDDYSETEQARAALRHYMGKGKPIDPLSHGIGTVGGLMPGPMNRLSYPHAGIKPIPGSPGVR